MKIEHICVGRMQELTYFIIDEKTNKTLIVDPGAEPERILEKIEKENLKVEAILITHGHFDHIGAVQQLKGALGCDVIAHEKAKMYLEDPSYNLSTVFDNQAIYLEADRYVQEADTIEVQGTDISLQVLYTPGHTLDSAVYYSKAYHVAFVGDVIFKSSVGRTDLKGGDGKQLEKSIQTKIFTLPEETVLYSGHGDLTTVGYEKTSNPYVRAV